MVEADLKGAATGLFELYNAGEGPDAAVRFREFLVTDPDQPTAARPWPFRLDLAAPFELTPPGRSTLWNWRRNTGCR